MRTLDQCFYRGGDDGLAAAAQVFREEGRGLGFSWGGWHPFRINTYLPTLKKLDPLANTSLGKAVWKPIEKVNQTVNKDFAKAKVWSQEHRKQLQIAAALALTAVGGMYAYGAMTAAEAGGAAAAGGAGTAAGASAADVAAAEFGGAGLAPLGSTAATASAVGVPTATSALTVAPMETLAPLTASAAPSLSLVPAVAPTTVAAASSYVPIAATATGTGLTFGGVASTAASLSPLMALGKLLGVVPAQQAAQQTADPYGYGYGAGGYGSGVGGGPGLGPLTVPADSAAAAVAGLPDWALPVAGTALLFILLKEK